VVVYVDDIIFRDDEVICKNFEKYMKNGFEMSMFGEMNFFLGLKIN
jgi:hypothetical protein